jgi:tetratricopeptide (TPR) repeat protein
MRNYVLFDAALELNQTDEAKACLDKVGAKESFAYLLRKSKWLDHIGQLDDAIAAMEKAANVAKEKSRESNYVWALANLGDMYGHAGRIQDAYTSFKKVLALQPTQLHALKGIAWIAYSHHGDVALARQIVNAIHEMRPVPDNYLLLAEFCEYEGRKAEAEKWQNEFLSAASAPVYGGMYNKYLIDLYAKSDMQPEKAVALAQRELANRKTPETMTWLAWAHFSSGNTEQVKSILGDPLLQEGGEPGLMAKRAVMLQKTGHKEAAQALLESLRENAFELGPVEMKGLQQIHLNP